jgi:hypothetical protein
MKALSMVIEGAFLLKISGSDLQFMIEGGKWIYGELAAMV